MIPLSEHPASVLIMLGGVAAGLIHVFSGPDHLAAIAPLAIRKQRGAWLTGLRWGTGHASGVVAVGVLSLLLRGILPVELISNWSDRLVGLMLLGIGFWMLRKALRVHVHEHAHEGETHLHVHAHGRTGAVPHVQPNAHVHTHAAFGIGTLHGLAGSAHFLAIIPSLAMPSTTLAVAYLVAYGIGTVLAMMLFASAIQTLTGRFAGAANVYRGLMFACSAVAMVVGGVWLLGFGF